MIYKQQKTMRKYVFFGSDIFRHSLYGNNHPLNIARVWPVIDICRAEGWLHDADYEEVPPASRTLLSRFHDPDYIEALWQAEKDQDLPEEMKDRFNIARASNPIFKEVYKRPATAAHASYLGAHYLVGGKAQIVFNPSGGTHHGQRGRANGFCFVNDPAIALQTMRQMTDAPITYLDIDAHHCDGVQDWHAHDPETQVISIHQDGLWPRTGTRGDRGGGNAHNLPLPEGSDDSALHDVMAQQIMPLIAAHQPQYIVLQAGADGHRDDPQSKLAYSLNGYWRAIEMVLGFGLPTLVLGGGGYNPYVTARAWAGIWALIGGISPYKLVLSQASNSILKGLSWHHRLGQPPASHWLTHLGDPQI